MTLDSSRDDHTWRFMTKPDEGNLRAAKLAAAGGIQLACQPGDCSMSFALYIIGFLIVIGGVAWALVTAGVSTVYVMITCVILLGIGILSAVTHTRSKDRPKDPSA